MEYRNGALLNGVLEWSTMGWNGVLEWSTMGWSGVLEWSTMGWSGILEWASRILLGSIGKL